MRKMPLLFTALCLSLAASTAPAQHLWWNLDGQDEATCLYGEITVLATHTTIYYCGANWHPGEPAGGYCGIQHNGPDERRTIFSIWDTSAELHPKITAAGPKTVFGRFGGEGEGGHTHMLWPWKVGETFQFFVCKQRGLKPDSTACLYYVYDRDAKEWRHSATITNPNGGKKCVATLSGGMNSFLENFSGLDREVPKLALYRLWLGTSVDKMKCLTRAHGDGKWGELHGAYFLAEGDDSKLAAVFAELEPKYGKPDFGRKDKNLAPIPSVPLAPELVKALGSLPEAKAVINR
ncbi:MAG: DUF3472 domain-containing protein [Thermoguttaceae bacterium]